MHKYTFKTIPRSRLSETVQNHVRRLILQRDIKPGDKLPTEEEIGKQFGVSIVTVREAMKGLRYWGTWKNAKERTAAYSSPRSTLTHSRTQ